MKNGICCYVTHDEPPRFREALDFCLGISAFNDNLMVVFAKATVRMLAQDCTMQPEASGERNFLKTLKMLELYDITNLYAIEEDCQQYGITQLSEDLPVKIVSKAEIFAKIATYQHTVTL